MYFKLWVLGAHTEIRGLCLMKWPSEMLQKFPMFLEYKNPHSFLFGFHFMLLLFPPNECPGICQNQNVGIMRTFHYELLYTYKHCEIHAKYFNWITLPWRTENFLLCYTATDFIMSLKKIFQKYFALVKGNLISKF